MPYNVLCRAFGESNSSAIEIVETFKKYGTVGVKRGEEAGSNRYVTIHDLVLDCARRLVGDGEEMKTLLKKWLFCFGDRGQDIRNETEELKRSPVEKFGHMKNVVMQWVISFGYGGRENSSFTEAHPVAGCFKTWWPETEDDEDNYLYRNVIRILKRACMFEEMVWLINEPWWIAKQLKVNGLQQIRADLDTSSECVRSITQMEQSEHELMEKWIRLLNAAIITSYDFVSKCEWDGMVYTQLYGRLQYYAETDGTVKTFLGKIKESAPRPFFLPNLGSFPTTSPQLLEKFRFEFAVRASKQIGNCIYTISDYLETSTPESRGNKNEPLEKEYRTSTHTTLVLQMNDLSNGTVTREKIVRINDELDYRCVLSCSCLTIVGGTRKGDIILLEKPVEPVGKEGESSSKDDINEDSETSIQPSKVQSRKVSLKKQAKRMVTNRRFESVDNPRQMLTHDNFELMSILSEENWISTVLRGHEDSVTSLEMSADGTCIVSASHDKTVRLWKKNNNEWQSTVLRWHKNWVRTVAISADGTRIVSGLDDNTMRLWEANNDKWHSTVLGEHEDQVSSLAISGDGTSIVSGSVDRTVRVWEEKNGGWHSSELYGHKRRIFSVAMSADRTRIVSGSRDNTVRVWDLRNEEWKFTALRGQGYPVHFVSISADGTRIVSGSFGKTVCVWEVKNNYWQSAALCGHEHTVITVAIWGGGSRLVSGSADNTMRLWETKNNQWQSTVLRGHEDWVRSVVISVDGTRIVSGSDDNTVRVWQVKNEKWQSVVLHGHNNPIRSVTQSADGTCIVSASADCSVRVWVAKNDKWRSVELRGHNVRRHKCSVGSVMISADGTCIVSDSQCNTVQVWELKNDEWQSTELCGHEDLVRLVSISSDGTRIVSSSQDNTVRVWESRFGQWNLSEIISVRERVDYVALSSNSDLIEINCWGRATQWWELSNGSWRECQDESKIFYEGHLNLESKHSLEGKSYHDRLTPAHMQALGVLESDPDVEELRCVFNGFYVRRTEWPYFGFITIVE